MVVQQTAPIRMFVVERQSLIAKALRSLFGRNPLVEVVGDATSVRGDDLRQTQPDLIIFGLENAAQEIAAAVTVARGALPSVRLCVLSSYANPDIMQRAIASGADGFIVKDISPAELDVAIEILASGMSYVDPRVAGGMLKRRYVAAGEGCAISELTAREADILRLIAIGLSNKEISMQLKLSEKTIKNYVSRIFSKVNVTQRTQAAVYAIKAGFA